MGEVQRLAAPEAPDAVRAVTSDEVAHFRSHGWVKLEHFFADWAVEGLLARARAQMGANPLTVSRAAPSELIANEYAWYARWDGPSHHDEWINAISHSRRLAAVAQALIGEDVRFYFDHVFVKRPAARGGGETPWHQDLPHHPLDRHGALTIWTPLVDCSAQMGTLRFLNGSHRAGLFGRYLNRRDGVSLLDEHPWVRERFELSPVLDLRAGDATVHDFAIVHYAQENATSVPRWTYTTQWIPASARYTGAPHHRTDGLGLAIDQPLDHPRFPRLA